MWVSLCLMSVYSCRDPVFCSVTFWIVIGFFSLNLELSLQPSDPRILLYSPSTILGQYDDVCLFKWVLEIWLSFDLHIHQESTWCISLHRGTHTYTYTFFKNFSDCYCVSNIEFDHLPLWYALNLESELRTTLMIFPQADLAICSFCGCISFYNSFLFIICKIYQWYINRMTSSESNA